MVLRKHEIEATLHAEKKDISEGRLKEDNPLDTSESYDALCEACRRGDLRVCQEKIQEGVNINARDRFDYTPLILASLCGHFEVVQLLLEAGALCERDTFMGERTLYNALTDQIRNLLLSYDYSKSRDPLQPLASHLTSLLTREIPDTSDITIATETTSHALHKFFLSARSPYFFRKLSVSPDTTLWRVPSSIPTSSLKIAIEALYLKELSVELGDNEEGRATMAGVEKLGRQLEMGHMFEMVLESDRRLQRQRRTEEVERGKNQLETWFEQSVLKNCLRVDASKADQIQWDAQNSIFADVLICASESTDDIQQANNQSRLSAPETTAPGLPAGIPVGPGSALSNGEIISLQNPEQQAVIFPAHKAMLIRSDYFNAMFSSHFKEAQPSPHLPVIHLDCSPAVLEVILRFLYTEQAEFGLEIALDVLFAADLLFIEKLKGKAATIISTLGNGTTSIVEAENSRGGTDIEDIIDVYDVIRAGWDTRVQRLEHFGARYIAHRLEHYIDEDNFKELVKESALRVEARQETDTVELIDDIRHYLSERFRLRFEDADLEDMMDDNEKGNPGSEIIYSEKPGLLDELNAKHQHVTEATGENTQPDQVAGTIRTLDGDVAGDEFLQDAQNYQILLGKIARLLDDLNLDA